MSSIQPLPDQIWQQNAIINPEANAGKKEIVLIIFNEKGEILRMLTLSRREFELQFIEDPTNPGSYLRKIKIDEVGEKTIKFLLLDKNGKSITDSRVIQKNLFLRNFSFLPNDQPPQKIGN